MKVMKKTMLTGNDGDRSHGTHRSHESSERESQVTQGDLDHGVRVQMSNVSVLFSKLTHFSFRVFDTTIQKQVKVRITRTPTCKVVVSAVPYRHP